MRFRVFFQNNVWICEEVFYNTDGTISFFTQGKDGKLKVTLKTYDLITEQINSIAVPLEVVKP